MNNEACEVAGSVNAKLRRGLYPKGKREPWNVLE